MELAYGEVDTMAQQELTSGTLACNDSLSRLRPINSQHDEIYWWLDTDGRRLCLYSDSSGLYGKLIGIIRFD